MNFVHFIIIHVVSRSSFFIRSTSCNLSSKSLRPSFRASTESKTYGSPPSIYENKNVLVVHFKYPDEPVKYDEMIQQAVEGL